MTTSLKTLMGKLPSGTNAAIITSDENRHYLTNMKSSAGTLIVTAKTCYFIIDFRYIEKAKTVISGVEVLLQSDDLYKQINEILAKENVKTVAIEADTVSVSQFKGLSEKLTEVKISDASDLSQTIEKLRRIKSSEELDLIKKAQAITDKTFLHMLDYIKQGMSEKQVELELEYTLRRLGATSLAFSSIVVSGANSSLPHGVASDKLLENGDFVTMDFGAAYNGYCSDMTRTIAIGSVSEEQKKVYDTVLAANLLAIDAISIGKKYSEIDAVARNLIYSSGYEGCFGHGLGHSLGLNIHEAPAFNTKCHEEITEDVIMTVEPGIYLSGKFGVRIEDMVFITKNETFNLTKSEKKLIIL